MCLGRFIVVSLYSIFSFLTCQLFHLSTKILKLNAMFAKNIISARQFCTVLKKRDTHLSFLRVKGPIAQHNVSKAHFCESYNFTCLCAAALRFSRFNLLFLSCHTFCAYAVVRFRRKKTLGWGKENNVVPFKICILVATSTAGNVARQRQK